MQIIPLGDNVLIRQRKEEASTASGLVLTADPKKKPEGEVIAVGPGRILDDGSNSPVGLVVGDNVVLRSWGGEDVKINGEELKLVSTADILAVIKY